MKISFAIKSIFYSSAQKNFLQLFVCRWLYFIGVLVLSSLGLHSCKSESDRISSRITIDWNKGVQESSDVSLISHINAVADIIGPVDGSAKLTIYTEGNHYPIFNKLVLNGFPNWCKQTSKCQLEGDEILLITLPQFILESSMSDGKLTLGNLVIPFSRTGVYPDLVFAGNAVIERLQKNNLIDSSKTKLATHKGMAILTRKHDSTTVDKLFNTPGIRWVYASEREKGARKQYHETIKALYGAQSLEYVKEGEVQFSERAFIQHRDIPFALVNGYADYGLLFYHLAKFYAEQNDELECIEIRDAAQYGKSIYWSSAIDNANPLRLLFEQYLQEVKEEAYGKQFIVSTDPT